jgi:hypothetical protein
VRSTPDWAGERDVGTLSFFAFVSPPWTSGNRSVNDYTPLLVKEKAAKKVARLMKA